MPRATQSFEHDENRSGSHGEQTGTHAARIKSEELLGQQREVEIDHQGRIYRLRLTQMNKLILTA